LNGVGQRVEPQRLDLPSRRSHWLPCDRGHPALMCSAERGDDWREVAVGVISVTILLPVEQIGDDMGRAASQKLLRCSPVLLVGALLTASLSASEAIPVQQPKGAPQGSAGVTAPEKVGRVGRRPNIVLIETDDMAERDLRAMPITARLVGGHGVRFVNSVAPSPLCCPSRASLLTGQYPHNHGVLGNGPGDHHPEGGFAEFARPGNTVATWLEASGYQTAFVGKYLNGYGETTWSAPAPLGWDEWHGMVVGSYLGLRVIEDRVNVYPHAYRTSFTNRVAVDIIRRRVPRPAPLMLFVTQFAPHTGSPVDPDDPIVRFGRPIYTPSPATVDRNTYRGVPVPKGAAFNEADVSDKPPQVRGLPRLTRQQVAALNEAHQQRLETLQAVDRGVGRIIRELRRTGELQNTVVIFTSDNGFLLGQHRLFDRKAWPYEPALAVPLLVRGPGFPRGAVRRQVVGTIDIAPTLVELAHARARRVLDGVSLLPLAKSSSTLRDRDLLIEMGPTSVGGPMEWRGLRTGGYTFARRSSGPRELYDLRTDPAQVNNLVRSRSLDERLLRTMGHELRLLQNCSGRECLVTSPF
jgi:N-acetylglucosamine-6-sulfatase